jgi:ABC-type transporter Mla subunit MlaD
MTVKFGDIAVTSQLQVRNSSKLIDSVVTNLNQVASNVNTTTTALTYTANSATKAINQTTTDLNTINDTIIKVSPILKHSDETIADLDSLLNDGNLHKTAINIQSMTSSGADILADGKIEADKFAHPPKKKITFWTATEAAGDFVRHFMPSIF